MLSTQGRACVEGGEGRWHRASRKEGTQAAGTEAFIFDYLTLSLRPVF
jgi:hypothetical protein